MTFGVGDVATGDNAGAYMVTITPGPASVLPNDQNRTPDRCPCAGAQVFAGGPFNTRTGNLYTTMTDLDVASPGPPLAWVRTYNSQATGDADQPGALGYGWQEPYATRLITAEAPGGEPGVAIIISASGNRLRFQDLGNGEFHAFPGVDATLTVTGDGYVETMLTREQVLFNSPMRWRAPARLITTATTWPGTARTCCSMAC